MRNENLKIWVIGRKDRDSWLTVLSVNRLQWLVSYCWLNRSKLCYTDWSLGGTVHQLTAKRKGSRGPHLWKSDSSVYSLKSCLLSFSTWHFYTVFFLLNRVLKWMVKKSKMQSECGPLYADEDDLTCIFMIYLAFAFNCFLKDTWTLSTSSLMTFFMSLFIFQIRKSVD